MPPQIDDRTDPAVSAIPLIAVLSAMFHVFSGWSWEVALISTTAGSLLFGLVFVRWQSVPAAIGVHAAWTSDRSARW
jgi:membrane protease YdiL (CAAX protease family)